MLGGVNVQTRFELRRRLGAGAMGVVYEAFDREREELVALKTLPGADGHWLARFKHEFRALHDLAHANLVRLGELFDGESEPFFTMELVRGVDFLSWVRPGASCDELRLRAALAQLVVGVAALHEAGKIHRDLKPSNILVAPDGRVVLVDFGLVAEAEAGRSSKSSDVVGTVAYMAPEQALSGRVTAAADWYSVGVILFEALTGERPHTGTTYEILMQKARAEVVSPRARVPSTPRDLDDLCRALLQNNPAERPQAREILQRLRASGAGESSRDSSSGGPIAPPFVGRAAELAALRAAYDSVRDGPLLYLIEGASGVGKSHLVDRFLHQLADEEPNTFVLTGRCYEREVVPFKALDGIADNLARRLARLPPAEVAEVLPRRAALLARLFPVLRRVEAIASAPLVPDVPDPHDQRRRMFAALRELFLRLADRRRLVWYIDDLQWTDADSVALLADLIASEDKLPVFIIATLRPVDDATRRERLATIEALAPTQRVRLDELTPADARELAERLLPGGDPAIHQAVASEAGGHPMLLHELARHALDSRRGAARSTTLDEMLAARIDRLTSGERALLEVVAVSGGPISHDVAAVAAQLTSAEEARAADVLRAAHLVRTDGVRRADRIIPYHDRVRERVQAQLDAARLRHVHERLALALEQTGAAERDPRALVRHARAAGRHALAAAHAQIAARQAEAALAFDQAAEFYAIAVELGSYDAPTLRALRIAWATTLMHAGRGPEAAAIFVTAAEGAEPAVRLECQRQAADQWIITGHLDKGMAALRALLDEIDEPLAQSPRRALARVVWNRVRLRLRGMGWVRRLESQVPLETLRRLDVLRAVAHGLAMIDNIRGADFNGRFLLLALRTGEARRLVGALASEVVFLASQAGGAGRRARSLFRRLVRLAEECPDPAYARTWVLLADGATSFFEGRFKPAVRSLEQAEEVFAEGPEGMTYEKNNTRVFRVHALRLLGALREHGTLIADLIRAGRQRGDRYLETTLQLLQGQSLLARDDVAGARRTIEEATWTPPEDGFHLQHWYELRARAELSLYLGDPETAAERLASRFVALERSMLLRVKLVRADAVALRGRLLLAAAARGHEPAQRRAEVRRIARQLDREAAGYATVYAVLLRAGLAHIEGQREATVDWLRQAVSAAAEHDMALHLAAARDRLGLLVGGDEGAALRAEAARFVAEQQIAEPERMFEIVAPGLDASGAGR
jgi:tetratricopeptide (TPR) repeat protein